MTLEEIRDLSDSDLVRLSEECQWMHKDPHPDNQALIKAIQAERFSRL
jgi:hypothetical protein